MFGRFARYKERQGTRDFIKRSEANVTRVEADAKSARVDLAKHIEKGSDPSSFEMQMLKDCVERMERNAATLRADHERFVKRSARSSPAYPRGIAVAEQE